MSRPKTNPDTVDKICKTCKKTFTISFYLRNKRTYCSKSCANHDPELISKMIDSQSKTFNEKYGTHPMKTETTKSNLKKSIKKKYGVDWISKSVGWGNTMKATKKKKYGSENYTNRNKAKQTCLMKYGVDNPTKYKPTIDSIILTKKTKHYHFLMNYCKLNNITMMCNEKDYNGYHWSNTYRFQCNQCSHVFDHSVYSLDSIFCEKCYPNKKETLENDFFDFLVSLSPTTTIKRRDRTILYRKELDFYLPDYKIAIEIDGLYWHSENGGGIKQHYHLNKFKGCIAHGVRLIHIFENEWRDRKELVKSVIKTILKQNKNKIIYARKCEIKNVTNKEKQEFLNKNHLQQTDKSTVKLGLYINSELVSLMTFRKRSRFDKHAEWELSRFCSLQDTIVVGGASKLFKYFIETYSPASIVSYSDRRYFSGDLYPSLGFSFINNTQPSYHYITPDYKLLINRMNFQKHLLKKKLKTFDPNLTEWENMKTNGWDRIWDCGHSKWMWKSNKINPTI